MIAYAVIDAIYKANAVMILELGSFSVQGEVYSHAALLSQHLHGPDGEFYRGPQEVVRSSLSVSGRKDDRRMQKQRLYHQHCALFDHSEIRDSEKRADAGPANHWYCSNVKNIQK